MNLLSRKTLKQSNTDGNTGNELLLVHHDDPHTQTYVGMLLQGDVEFLLQLHRWADSVRQLAALLRSVQRVRVHVLPHAADL